MRLGTDLDGVILDCDTAYLNVINLLYGTSYTAKDIVEYDIAKCLGISSTVVKSVINAVIGAKACVANQQAIESLTEISKIVESPIYIITARNPMYSGVTTEIVESAVGDRFKYEIIHNKEFSLSKSDIIKDKKLDVFIEDYAATAYSIARETSCISILLDKFWNRKYNEDILEVIRAPSWEWIKNTLYFSEESK